jgi:hypothetical protein
MQYVCDAVELTWFRFETLGEAGIEGRAMSHAVERYFRDAYSQAVASYRPPKGAPISEQNIGLKPHVLRSMPVFLTLRNRDGKSLVTAMLPPEGKDERSFRPIVVGPSNADPYPEHSLAIVLLADHFGYELNPDRCYPYKRG